MVRKSQHPTVPPAFDVARYAKDSDAFAAAKPVDVLDEPGDTHAQSATRLATRPNLQAVPDETWVRSMVGIPVPAVSPAELRQMPLDHRAGFLISLMDGRTELDTVIEIAAMPRAEALRLVRDLFVSGIIDFRY
jgi:hypothetical protein